MSLPNVDLFKEQIAVFKQFLMASAMDADSAAKQAKDIGFLLAMGEVFTLVAYGQLILEFHKLEPEQLDEDTVAQIFDVLVRDFSKYALQIYEMPSSSEAQMAHCLQMIRKPRVDEERYERLWQEQVLALKDAYVMND